VIEQEGRTLPVTLQSAEVLKHKSNPKHQAVPDGERRLLQAGVHGEMKKNAGDHPAGKGGPPDTTGPHSGLLLQGPSGIRVSSTSRRRLQQVVSDRPEQPAPPDQKNSRTPSSNARTEFRDFLQTQQDTHGKTIPPQPVGDQLLTELDGSQA
jgi:hypothetical protein